MCKRLNKMLVVFCFKSYYLININTIIQIIFYYCYYIVQYKYTCQNSLIRKDFGELPCEPIRTEYGAIVWPNPHVGGCDETILWRWRRVAPYYDVRHVTRVAPQLATQNRLGFPFLKKKYSVENYMIELNLKILKCITFLQ